MQDFKVKNALISVSDKSGLAELGKGLMDFKVDVLSTGGTFKLLHEHGVSVREVSDYTGFPEMMDGRVKTLHPKIHGGLLGRRNADGGGIDVDVMADHEITGIDLVVVNLYPFEKTVADPDATLADAIENIDIGGPTMIRASAKNFPHVLVVVDPEDYGPIIEGLNQDQFTLAQRQKLAQKAFQHVAMYDTAISQYLYNDKKDFPDNMTIALK